MVIILLLTDQTISQFYHYEPVGSEKNKNMYNIVCLPLNVV